MLKLCLSCDVWSVLITALVMLGAGVAHADNLLRDTTFGAVTTHPALVAWRIDPAVGGRFSAVNHEPGQKASIIELRSERVVLPDGGQSNLARLIQTARNPIVPGRKYTLRVEARGDGNLSLGLVEFVDKYSPVRVDTQGKSYELSPDWQTFSFDYSPSDAAMYASTYFQLQSWLGRVQLRNPSLEPVVQQGNIEVQADDFVFDSGKPVKLKLNADHASVKLLLYGPDGVPPGPGGEYGGSDAWTDHFIQSTDVNVKPGNTQPVSLDVPADARQGFYRIMAVDTVTGQHAETAFCIYPPATAQTFRKLASQVKLAPGSRLVFVGDSLTAHYPGRNYFALLSRAFKRHHPDQVQLFNAAVGGDNIVRIEKRLEKDVIALKPTHVFLFEGANDTKRYYRAAEGLSPEWSTPLAIYQTTYRSVVERIQAETNARVILMTTAPGDQNIINTMYQRVMALGDNANIYCMPEEIAKAVNFQKELAKELSLQLIDTNAHLQNLLDKNDPSQCLFVDDGVHLSEHGNREVALTILQYLANNAQ